MKNTASEQTIKMRKEKAVKIIKELKRLFPHTKIALNYSNNLELLVAVILSAQATDKKINEITAKLFKKYKTLDDYAGADIKEFEQDIKSAGFYHNKAKNILATAKIIRDKFNGRIPDNMEEILTLPGVARKTANIVLGNAYGIVEGIAVDTHVRRLAKLLGLTDETDPDKIERDIMAIVPKEEWRDFSYRLIDYGRKYCPARKHDHEKCLLNRIK